MSASEALAPIGRADLSNKVPGTTNCFFLKINSLATTDVLTQLLATLNFDAQPVKAFEAFDMLFKCNIPEVVLLLLANNPAIDWLEEDVKVEVNQQSAGGFWGLDRIDQRSPVLDGQYNFPLTGQGQVVYVVDTGVRGTHAEFRTSAGTRVQSGYDATTGTTGANTDCQGHGTHVAGIAAGKSAGVARAAEVVPVRVLSCAGTGSSSWVIGGMDWISRQRRGVVNLSLGSRLHQPTNDAVERLVAAGYHVVVAAGNDGADGCNYSPGTAPSAINVGSILNQGTSDRISSFSNRGRCVHVMAPGDTIRSAAAGDDTSFTTKSGTSMASPMVAGVVAALLGQGYVSPADMKARILAEATPIDITADPKRLVQAMTDASAPPPATTDPVQPAPESEPQPQPTLLGGLFGSREATTSETTLIAASTTTEGTCAHPEYCHTAEFAQPVTAECSFVGALARLQIKYGAGVCYETSPGCNIIQCDTPLDTEDRELVQRCLQTSNAV